MYFRYLSRCVLIEFVHPRIDSTISEFDKLHQLMESSSSAVGFLISLGKQFLINSTKDLDEQVLPKLKSALEDAVIPRIYIGYGILIWFVLKVIIASPIFISYLCKHCLQIMSKGRIENLKEDFWEYVTQEVALNMKKFQNVTQEIQEKNCTKENSYTMDHFAEELLKIVDGMPVYQVS